MSSLEFIGAYTIVVGSGWLAWKFFESNYERAKKRGGPEWIRMKRLTILGVGGAAIGSGLLAATFLAWLER